MESDDEDCNTSLRLGLGFQSVDLLIHSNKPERKRKSYDLQGAGGSSPLLSLSLSESNRLSPPDDDRVRDSGDQTTSDDLEKLRMGVATAPAPAPAEAAPMSTLTAISSFSHASRLSDEDEDCSTPKKKLRLSRDQISILEDSFKVHSTLNPNQKQDLAAQLNLRPRQVEVWFQNRRARIKMKQTELDCESLKKCCETLNEENRRLHKEVMELKSIKQTVPFLMQLPTGLPVPALTMCPSCEKISRSTIPDGDGSSTTSLFSSTSSNNAPKTRLCKSVH